MTTPNSAFYRQQADETSKLAAATKLSSVRENLLQSEKAWRRMADSAADREEGAALRQMQIAERS